MQAQYFGTNHGVDIVSQLFTFCGRVLREMIDFEVLRNMYTALLPVIPPTYESSVLLRTRTRPVERSFCIALISACSQVADNLTCTDFVGTGSGVSILFVSRRMASEDRKPDETSTGNLKLMKLSKDELQFVKEAKASGLLKVAVDATRNNAAAIDLGEIMASTNDHNGYVESLAKKASAIQLNLERCKTLVQSSETSDKDRLEAKISKLNSLKTAKARLEEARSSEELELRQTISNNLSHIEKLATDPSHLNGTALGTRDKPADQPVSNHSGQFFDKLLEKLQALGREIKVSHEDKSLVKAARYYAHLEVMLSVVTCKRTLNFVLKEALKKYALDRPVATSYADAFETEVRAVVEEISSLWDEVVPVAHMAVEKTMLGPILQFSNVKAKSHKDQNAVIGSYICSCLSFMNERLELLASRVDMVVHHHFALLSTYEQYQSLNADKTAAFSHISPKSRAMDTANNPRISEEATALMSQLRQSLEVHSGLPSKAVDPLTPAAKRIALLNEYLAKRAAKDDERLRSLHAAFESAVKPSLNEGTGISNDVLECLVADSLKGSGHRGAVFRDGQTEESLEVLESENREIRVLQQTLKLPQLQVNKVLRPAASQSLSLPDAHRSAVPILDQGQRGHTVGECEENASTQISSKGAEIMKRWG
ncbi:hypothetical protein SCARD494_13641 [Seiridium cardinale]